MIRFFSFETFYESVNSLECSLFHPSPMQRPGEFGGTDFYSGRHITITDAGDISPMGQEDSGFVGQVGHGCGRHCTALQGDRLLDISGGEIIRFREAIHKVRPFQRGISPPHHFNVHDRLPCSTSTPPIRAAMRVNIIAVTGHEHPVPYTVFSGVQADFFIVMADNRCNFHFVFLSRGPQPPG